MSCTPVSRRTVYTEHKERCQTYRLTASTCRPQLVQLYLLSSKCVSALIATEMLQAGQVPSLPPSMCSPSTYASRLSNKSFLPLMSHWIAENGSITSEMCSHSFDLVCVTSCPP